MPFPQPLHLAGDVGAPSAGRSRAEEGAAGQTQACQAWWGRSFHQLRGGRVWALRELQVERNSGRKFGFSSGRGGGNQFLSLSALFGQGSATELMRDRCVLGSAPSVPPSLHCCLTYSAVLTLYLCGQRKARGLLRGDHLAASQWSPTAPQLWRVLLIRDSRLRLQIQGSLT